MIWAILLLILGLGFVLAEVFFPSFGILSIVAGLCILLADIKAFHEGGNFIGWTFIVAEIVLVPLVVWFAFRTLPKVPMGQKMLLQGPTTTPVPAVPNLDHLAGATGTAESDLRPSGMAMIHGERVSVVSVVGMIDRGTAIVVERVEGGEVRVRKQDAEMAPAAVKPLTETT